MKAVIFRRHGGPEVLEYADVPDPSLAPGHVLVRVKACALNHLDHWVRQGITAYRILLPHISGADVAGIVEQVAPDVTTLRAGQAVLLTPGLRCGRCARCRADEDTCCPSYGIRGAANDGGYAELTAARAEDVLPLPPGMSMEEAAALPLVFLTAWHMLVTRARLRAGETVLIHAAGSGVGHAAVQIAKHLGAVVYATVGSDAKAAKAKILGADEVINYRQVSFEERIKALTEGQGVQVVFEHIGPETWEGSLKSLARGGRLVTCGATSGPTAPLDLRYVFSRQLSLLGSTMGTRRELLEIILLFAAKHLRPVVDTVFPLAEAQRAQERMLSRDVFGKLVLRPHA